MPYRKISFKKENSYHIVSKAEGKTEIFTKEKDRCRFIFQMYCANNGKPILNAGRRDMKEIAGKILRGEKLSRKIVRKKHKPFLNVLNFTLARNHYHLHVLPLSKDSVPLFMQRLNGGFSKYFNLEHKRKGSLFKNRYKARLIKGKVHADMVQRYISIISPLDFYKPEWRKRGIKNSQEALKFLKQYPFSSFPDNLQERNSKLIASKKIKQKLDLPQGNEFFNLAQYFLRVKSKRPCFFNCLE